MIQKLKPYRIIVVNDGSTDHTGDIVSKYNEIELINKQNVGKSLQTRKELALTINAGLEKLRDDKNCDYIMKLDADIILPKNYLSKIIQRMNSDPKLVVTSGIIKGEKTLIPRGAGRLVKTEFWKKLGLMYPVNYGFEGYLLLKARSMGYTVKVFEDLEMETLRKTGSKYNPQTYFYYGLGMKSLGYTLPFVLVRVLGLVKKKPKAAYFMLKGFFSENQNLYEKELRDFVKKTQYSKIKHFGQ